MLEVSLDAAIIVDEQGKILEFNPAAERMFGHGYHEVVRRSCEGILLPIGSEWPKMAGEGRGRRRICSRPSAEPWEHHKRCR